MPAKKAKKGKARRTRKKLSASKKLGSINPLRLNYDVFGSEKA